MITIITGASHCGKTLLAQKFLERYKTPYLCIDHLKMGLIRSGNTRLTPEDDDELTDYLWPIVSEIIKTAIENDQSLTIEGCYIPFNWREKMDPDYQSHIRFIYHAFYRVCFEDNRLVKLMLDIMLDFFCPKSRSRSRFSANARHNARLFLLEKSVTKSSTNMVFRLSNIFSNFFP